MPAIGITGGIATGKSTFKECLRELVPAATFFDADLAAREVVDLPEVKEELAREFGREIFSYEYKEGRSPDRPGGLETAASWSLNRGALRAIVFRDAAKKRALEEILHPRIRRQWSAIAETHRNSTDFFFADIPLLYETSGESLCDQVVVVASSRSSQVTRLMQKKSIDRQEAEQMINSQMPLEEKIRRADHVVWNNGDRSVLIEQTRNLVALWQL